MISLYAKNSLRKYTGFTFGLNEKDTDKREKNQVILIMLHNEASENDEQRLFSPWMHLLHNHLGHFVSVKAA